MTASTGRINVLCRFARPRGQGRLFRGKRRTDRLRFFRFHRAKIPFAEIPARNVPGGHPLKFPTAENTRPVPETAPPQDCRKKPWRRFACAHTVQSVRGSPFRKECRFPEARLFRKKKPSSSVKVKERRELSVSFPNFSPGRKSKTKVER